MTSNGRSYAGDNPRSVNRAAPELIPPRDRLSARPCGHHGSFSAREIANLYRFPPPPDSPQPASISVISLNAHLDDGSLAGGYNRSDLARYFACLGIPVPSVTDVFLTGGVNRPGFDAVADKEVTCAVEVIGAMIPEARLTVYFAENSSRGLIDSLYSAVFRQRPRPSAVSISWGSSEDNWTPTTMRLVNRAIQEASSAGITVCCAAGNHGYGCRWYWDGTRRVEFPASSPYSLACGGTKLTALEDTVQREVVWNAGGTWASGGGSSDVFAMPAWQQTARIGFGDSRIVGRAVPDVSAHADTDTGFQCFVGGADALMGGTSIAAPVWAALITRINEWMATPIRNFTELLYTMPELRGCFNPIVEGDNGLFEAGRGWNACTGWGSPNGMKLLEVLLMRD